LALRGYAPGGSSIAKTPQEDTRRRDFTINDCFSIRRRMAFDYVEAERYCRAPSAPSATQARFREDKAMLARCGSRAIDFALDGAAKQATWSLHRRSVT
jgi:hypothetical protein